MSCEYSTFKLIKYLKYLYNKQNNQMGVKKELLERFMLIDFCMYFLNGFSFAAKKKSNLEQLFFFLLYVE